MVELEALSIAVVVHAALRNVIFFSFDECDAGLMPLGSWIMLVALCFTLAEKELVGRRFTCGSRGEKIVVEAIASLFFIELVMVFVWMKLEVVCYFVIKTYLPYGNWSLTIANATITIAAATFLSMAINCTSAWPKLQCHFIGIKNCFQNPFNSPANCKLPCIPCPKPKTYQPQPEPVCPPKICEPKKSLCRPKICPQPKEC